MERDSTDAEAATAKSWDGSSLPRSMPAIPVACARRWPTMPVSSLPHRELIRPADEIVAYFGTVVSSYPTARWEVTDVISDGERAAVQFTLREFASHLGRSSSPSKWRSCARMRGRSPASSAITTRASFASSSERQCHMTAPVNRMLLNDVSGHHVQYANHD